MNKETEKEFEEKFRKYIDGRTFEELKLYIGYLLKLKDN